MVALYTPGRRPLARRTTARTPAPRPCSSARCLRSSARCTGRCRSRGGRAVLAVAAPLCLLVVVAPWFASDATAVHDFFYGQYGLFVYCVATAIVLWRLTQPRARRARRRAVVGTRPLGGRDLLRDVPLALAHLPRGHPGPDRSRRAPAARSSSLHRRSRSRGPPRDWSTTRSAAACACVRHASRGSWSAPLSSSSASGCSRRRSAAQPALSGQVGQVADQPRAPDHPNTGRAEGAGRRRLAGGHPRAGRPGRPRASTGSPPNPASRSGTGRFSPARS